MILARMKHVPHRVQRVDLGLVVVVATFIDIEKDLEIVVLVDHRVPLRNRSPDIFLLQSRREVKIFVVPQNRCPSHPPRCGGIWRLMIFEGLRPRCVPLGLLV